MIDLLRSGAWIAGDRLLRLARPFLVMQFLALSALFLSSNGRVDVFDRPIGTDFSEIWVAGVFTLEGHPEKPFDNVAHEARQKEFFSETSGFFAWSYPPTFLALAALFATMPYWLALLAWLAATAPLFLLAATRIVAHPSALLAAAAFPAFFINVVNGHNGFLTAGLLAFGLLWVDRRPWLAGLCFGLLAYKPQFGLLIPFALAAGGHWRAFAAATLTVLATAGGTVAAWGLEPWRQFLIQSDWSRDVLLEQGSTGFHKIQSVFAAVRLNGGSIGLAYALHGAAALAVGATTVLAWRKQADLRLRAAMLMIGALVTTPYCLDYDTMILGPAVAFAASYGMEKGFRPWEKTALAAVYVTPILARPAALAFGVHVCLLAALALFILLAARALRAEAPEAQRQTQTQTVDAPETSRVAPSREVGGFALVGGLGFLVDAGLTAALAALGLGPVAARAPAILAALATTFALNRAFVFAASGGGVARDFGRYLVVSAGGAALNAAVYLVVSTALERVGLAPAAAAPLGVAAGSGVAMVANYLGYRGFAFRPAR